MTKRRINKTGPLEAAQEGNQGVSDRLLDSD